MNILYLLLPCPCGTENWEGSINKPGFLLWWMLFAASSHPSLLFGLVLGAILQLQPGFWEQTGTTLPWQQLILIFFSRENCRALERCTFRWKGPQQRGIRGKALGSETGEAKEKEFHTRRGWGRTSKQGLGLCHGH